jgi:plasmid stability protein
MTTPSKPRARARRGTTRRRSSGQLTVRNVPIAVENALRRRAAGEGVSLNQVLVDSLARAAGAGAPTRIYDDLDQLAGRWEDDPAIDAALAAQDEVDESLWR